MKRIPTLDGWRAVAILVVLVHHAARASGYETWWAWRGAIGVDVFFAISGLLITSQLLQDGDLKRFYIRRAFRILPPAIFYLAIVFGFQLIDGSELVHCLTIQRNYVGGSYYTSHFWSLSLEEQFYLVWPIVLLCSGKRAPVVALVGILAVGVWRGLAWSHLSMWYVRADTRCDGLLWGCLSAFWLRSANRLRLRQTVCVASFFVAVVVWGIPAFLVLTPLLLSIAVLGTVQQPSWVVSRLLESKPLVWIGQRSYGIYLWQQLFIFTPVKLPLYVKLAASIVLPAILYRFFESPLRQIGRRIAVAVRPPRPAVAPGISEANLQPRNGFLTL